MNHKIKRGCGRHNGSGDGCGRHIGSGDACGRHIGSGIRSRTAFIAALLCALCATLLLPLAAVHADLLVEPQNGFYEKHRKQCQRLGRDFYANGEGGSIALKNEPGATKDITSAVNGRTMYVGFTYKYKGVEWGIADLYPETYGVYGKTITGWVPMEQLAVVYDYISFSEDHAGEFHDYTGDYSAFKDVSKIIAWAWPGSGITNGTVYVENFNADGRFEKAYTDPKGREWGYIGYLRGQRNLWICADAPEAEDIEAFNPAPAPGLYAPSEPAKPSGAAPSLLGIIVMIVLTLVSGTAILIYKLW